MDAATALLITIRAQDQASGVITGAAANAKAAAASINDTSVGLSKISGSLTSIGSALTRSVTLPIAAVAGVSTAMAYTFNQKMELLRTSAGIPQSAIAGLSQTVLNMAGEVGQAPDKLAEGLYHIASAGNGIWNTSQMLDILKTASEGANLGMADLDTTTYSLSSAMASGIKGAKDASDMMAILSATVGAGDMKMEDLNGALSTGILSSAATFGISIQSVGAALATLTDNGEHADEAATRLRMTISLMSSPSSVAAKQLKALGLTAEDAKNATDTMNKVFAESGLTTTKLADDLRKPNGIAVAVEDLKTHLEDAGLSASEADAMLSKAFGGGRTDAALLTMLQNTTRLDDKYKAINDSAGQFNQKIADLNNTPQMKIQKAWDGMQADLIKIGGNLLPLVANGLSIVANGVDGITKWFNQLSPLAKGVLGTLIAGLAVGGPLILGAGKFIGTLTTIHDGFIILQAASSPLFSALTTGFGALANMVIPNVRIAFMSLSALIASPIVMPAIAVGAALAAIASVYTAYQNTMNAINQQDQQESYATSSSVQMMKNAVAQYNAGKITRDQELNLIHIAAKANGGPVQAGEPYLVGDNPDGSINSTTELFIPKQSGTIVPADQLRGMMSSSNGSGGRSYGGTQISIGQVTIANQMDQDKFLKDLGWRLSAGVGA